MKYCLSCGARNELDAVFCKKCATSFNPQKKSTHVYAAQQDREIVPKQRRGRQKQIVPEPEETVDTEIGEENEGVSLNYCPQLNEIQVESITS